VGLCRGLDQPFRDEGERKPLKKLVDRRASRDISPNDSLPALPFELQ